MFDTDESGALTHIEMHAAMLQLYHLINSRCLITVQAFLEPPDAKQIQAWFDQFDQDQSGGFHQRAQ